LLLVGLAMSAHTFGATPPYPGSQLITVAKAVLTTNTGIPEIEAPGVDATLSPGDRITARGAGIDLSWSVEYWSARNLAAGMHMLAYGSGSAITFTVPNDASGNTLVRATLMGRWGSVYRDFKVGTQARARHPDFQQRQSHSFCPTHSIHIGARGHGVCLL
jgi:hypothetical protein